MTVGFVHKLESFGLVDGPGVRFVVFLQGCRMRCRYCHNPETWKLSAGTPMSPEELFSKAIRYKSYWKNNGGVTVSGGEPLLQLDFLTEFFEICRTHSVHTALDTSGNPFEKTPEYLQKFDRLLDATSLVLLDLKMLDARAHQELTGKPNENILQMAEYLSEKGVPMWIRRVLVPGMTDGEEELRNTYEFIRTLRTVRRVEVLPYHALAIPKYQQLGIPYSLMDAKSPTPEQIRRAEEILHIKDFWTE
ncbi:pyruvate formate-lyase-activating protein [uncultured Fibrobacter sp.]|uniref:pyruvate formate-lyase-activating protein n=1 Tax=uncultured Fibrobacter sp. TaxID=261512 RepID=UPI002804BCC4|nr:pyruvate formate-lyase-activating protein [uncultured Fibrobacter sp.]